MSTSPLRTLPFVVLTAVAWSLLLPSCGSGVTTVRRISAADLHASVAAGTAVVVDVRDELSYKLGHIKGAISIPLADLPSRAGQLPGGKLVATYCS